MATIQKNEGKRGTTYRTIIRRKGYPALSKTFHTKKDATNWAREHDREAKLSQACSTSRGRRKTVSDAIEQYIEDYTGRDPTKITRLAWWKEEIGDTKLAELNPSLIADCLDKLARGKAQHRKGKEIVNLNRRRSGPTVNRYHGAISIVLEKARSEWHWISENPAKKVTRKKENKGRVRYLTDDERTALLEACHESTWDSLYLLVILALSTGARQGELLNLSHSDLDLERGEATLEDTKNNDRRVLPLLPAVVDEIKRLPRRLDTDLLFPSTKDPSKPFAFRVAWEKAVDAAEINDFRFHDLRHSCASYLAMDGATLLEIADVLGHKTLAMVKRYSHLSADHKRKVVEGTFMDKQDIQRKLDAVEARITAETIREDEECDLNDLTLLERNKRRRKHPDYQYSIWLAILKDVLETRDPLNMGLLIMHGCRSVKAQEPIPYEVVEFIFDRLMEALVVTEGGGEKKATYQKIAQAIYLTGRPDKFSKHVKTTVEILLLEFQHREKDHPVSLAIDDYLNQNQGKNKSKRYLRSEIYDKHLKMALLALLLEPDISVDLKRWAENKLSRL